MTGNSTERCLTSNIKANDGHFPINTISKIILITFRDNFLVPQGFPFEIFLEISRICSLFRIFPKPIPLIRWYKMFFSFTVCQFSLYFNEKIKFLFFGKARKFKNFESSAKRQPIRMHYFDSLWVIRELAELRPHSEIIGNRYLGYGIIFLSFMRVKQVVDLVQLVILTGLSRNRFSW